MRKKCKIKRVWALRGGWKVVKKSAKLRGLGHCVSDCEKSAKLRGFGALRGRWRVDCKKSAKLRGLGH